MENKMDIDTSILEMRKQPHLSASSIKAYLDCGLYYKFSRVDKLARTHTSDNLLFGSTIHKVLADYNQEKVIGNYMGLEDLTQLFTTTGRKQLITLITSSIPKERVLSLCLNKERNLLKLT
jgi:hypothetical protein